MKNNKFLIVAILLASISACGGSGSGSGAQNSNTQTNNSPVPAAVANWDDMQWDQSNWQ